MRQEALPSVKTYYHLEQDNCPVSNRGTDVPVALEIGINNDSIAVRQQVK